jgi:hypothetical protein
MVTGVPVRRQIETSTWDNISRLSTPMLLGGQDQLLKVSIYTVDMERFFWLSAVVLMSFFISHIETSQNSLKILQTR